MNKIELEDNGKKGRFVIYEDGVEAGEMTFTWAGEDKFIIDHTGVDEKFGGKGYAKQLVMAGVEFAREKGVKVIPLCPYAKKRFDQDESIGDVLA
ncbi:N-acetyltransferase [Weeksellaceae bacterium KMM 9713]|uniref:N-acetyltransferase n=1 Tax=Profundicola chukchiensis TaxID=2961959 RepID=A0A9X4RX83_9FLAO|nr:GNAT family N-acetyltransferase [Profundicola chukchiensis]MDG4945824.1 N-acetyltransferase [Profundicola chukchiensis]MDG4951492.1 N-acetyltransferase [Profundicola chukchiensis]